jgi:hypothetical protein
MSPLPYPPSRPLSVGETLDLTFRMYRATLAKCLPLAALAVVISQVPSLYLLLSARGLKQPLLTVLRDPFYVVLYVVSGTLVVVLYAAVLLRQYKMVNGGQPGGELAAALRRAPALVLLTVLFSLSLAACGAAALLFPDPVRWGVLLLLVFPAWYVLVSFSIALAVLLISGAAPLTSLTRSWRLMHSSFWRLTVTYIVAFVILLVLGFLIGAAIGLIVELAAHGDVAVVTAAFAVVVVALVAFAVPFYMAVQLAVFGDLTARREGTDLAQRISATA